MQGRYIESMEPYCLGCVARFTQQRIPYMLKCCHVICSECLIHPGFTGNCPSCQDQSERTFAPAFDVWDLIEVLRKGEGDFPPSLWPTVNKTNVACWGLLARTCSNKDNACPFQHDQATVERTKVYQESVQTSNQSTITSSGWCCRCGLEYVFGATCQFCLQSFSIK